MLANEVYEFRGQVSELKVTRGSMIFLRREKRNGIYFLKGVVERSMATVVNE